MSTATACRASPRPIAFLAGEVVDERAVGDHALVTCAVLEADCDDGRRPLVFFGGAFGSFAA